MNLTEAKWPMADSDRGKQTAQKLNEVKAAYQAMPTWELTTIIVGALLIILAASTTLTPAVGTLSIINQIVPPNSGGIGFFTWFCTFCGGMMLLAPKSKYAPLFSLPLLFWAMASLDYVVNNSTIANAGTPVILFGAGIVAWLSMTRGRS